MALPNHSSGYRQRFPNINDVLPLEERPAKVSLFALKINQHTKGYSRWTLILSVTFGPPPVPLPIVFGFSITFLQTPALLPNVIDFSIIFRPHACAIAYSNGFFDYIQLTACDIAYCNRFFDYIPPTCLRHRLF
ncbi:hypothetical protein MHI24_16345 [Paenibacillus sp. FSL K6-1096]|uniref:hypothetical protein n=1 Tax=Paenibacillus sp. FSL K6-1096 TaxID=2921460 RepID=UPI0030EE8550